ncbi:MAG TPA: DUF4112 domain-containing protein [Candidatus Limnocylindrales bacterium]|nr:DUF4112 domain-containing protein [Candidatus Limnocylindrales bacterium]
MELAGGHEHEARVLAGHRGLREGRRPRGADRPHGGRVRSGTRARAPVEIEKSLERLSWLLDDLFRIPGLGWRIGLDPLVGLVPVVGDTATAMASLYVLAAAVRYRVPKVTLLRMGLNLGIDYALGSLPLVGDLFDAWWKSNRRNVTLLRQRATVSASEARRGRLSDWIFVGLIVAVLIAIAAGAVFVSLYLLATLAGWLAS